MQQSLDFQASIDQPDPPPAVYIIIPVHNRKEITLTCLKHLQENGDLDRYSVVVVDDGSTDGTAEAIQAQFPIVTILYGDGNLWWTGAIKMGMKYALTQKADYIIWLNDDCLPQKYTLNTLVEFLENHSHTIVGAACYLNKVNILIKTGCLHRTPLTAEPNTVTFVDSLSGYCVGFPSNLCSVIGLPDESRFPHYRGDDLYILQATRSGFQACILGDAKAFLTDIVNPPKNLNQYLKQNPKNKSIKSVFLNKKSKYYLPSNFFYFIKKYKATKGALLFSLKLLLWSYQYLDFLLIDSFFKRTQTKHNQ
ncbi:glycosyltransferase family 2 protein [Synechococcus sp. BDU 130192]|uniref:glycosyltransferase family 2 protein n=1 Tax=Synechococcus sp. BDU 130192 TaxID=2042059 RepID=UPI000C08CEE4|nr:glycosyltransferase family 2 protein [Synechococcus sp. BDU 130192]